MINIITLMDDANDENKSLKNEHGLSMWVETDTQSFLFDCGAGTATLHNAHKLGIDLAAADFTVCTHNHYDHAAGYRDLAEKGLGGRVLYTGPGFLEKKYAFDGKKYVDLSSGIDLRFLEHYRIEHRVCTDILPLSDHCWLIGNFNRTNSLETIPKRFVKGTLPQVRADDFSDEICLAAESRNGLVLLVGCSHPGILNMVETIRTRLKKPIYALFGGTHLVEADPQRIQSTLLALGGMGISILGFSHCSGSKAEQMLEENTQFSGCHMSVGSCVAFE
ncbi:MBL fold metallo-hydrolase [Caproicibacter fermentans]|uniref:MBL fold metallo-hydrolase n=1 Tax=Caproicibacter fermentans TaxID=2576756 RepID=A0A7G8T8Y6_9FIRM|nr:MBL fold metallo-hydrolase [Caproicibacter fermentans]QNK40077.1 MBL fold metallo-hydrolase [Caproicibacter fermentans]